MERARLDREKLKRIIAVGVALTAAGGLTSQQITQHVDALAPAFEEYEIDTCDRVAAALAQFAHETGGYRWLKELGGESYLRRYQGYPGRGYIHVTWLSNYQEMQKCTGLPIVVNPKLVEQPEVAAKVSACWWQRHRLNQLADLNDMKQITRIINGGYSGLSERMKYYRALKSAFEKDGVCAR